MNEEAYLDIEDEVMHPDLNDEALNGPIDFAEADYAEHEMMLDREFAEA